MDKHSQPPERLYSLDILRSAAILSVLFFHAIDFSANEIPSALHKLFSYGWIGVDLFFILSGFLIANYSFSDLKRKQMSLVSFLKIFWTKRWLRTLPLYYFALVVYIFLKPLLGHGFNGNPWEFLLFIQNYNSELKEFVQSWSLAVEEHFYLLFPFICYIFSRFPWRKYIWGGIIVACIALRAYSYAVLDPEDPVLMWATHLRLDSLAWGVLLAENFDKWVNNKTFQRIGLLASIVFFTLFLVVSSSGNASKVYFLMYTLLSISFASFFIFFYNFRFTHFTNMFFNKIAVLSYGAYVWFALVARLAANHLHFHWTVNVAIYFGLTFLCAQLTFSIIETPFLKIRSKVLKSLKL